MSRERLNLTFHGLGPVEREFDPGEGDVWVGADVFEAILDLVRDRADVRITFDDGNASDAEIALPALRERGLTGAFLVLADRIDRDGFLSTAQIREMAAAGMEIGSHGAGHTAWRGLRGAALEAEITGAKTRIEEALGAPISTAACPFGSYDRHSLRALRDAGFTTVYTSDRWRASPGEWLQARYTIKDGDSPDSLRRLLDARPGPLQSLVNELRMLVKRWR